MTDIDDICKSPMEICCDLARAIEKCTGYRLEYTPRQDVIDFQMSTPNKAVVFEKEFSDLEQLQDFLTNYLTQYISRS